MNGNISGAIGRILSYSTREAIRLNSHEIKPEHLLLAILADRDNSAYRMLVSMRVPIDSLKNTIENKLTENAVDNNDSSFVNRIVFNDEAKDIITYAVASARAYEHRNPGTADILLSMMRNNKTQIFSILNDMQVSYDDIARRMRENILPVNGSNFTEDDDMEQNFDCNARSNKQGHLPTISDDSESQDSATPTLDKFTIDMTRKAQDGELDPVVGREREIERLAQILSRRKKNNPVLIGEPGVGKSAIVEGLALRIVEKKVPRILFGKRILSLDMA